MKKQSKNGAPFVYCAHSRLVPTDKLKENPANPNTHPPEQIALLARIIEKQGWRNPIVVSNRSGLITKGHARLQAARALSVKSCPVDFQDYKSEKQELADMVADNRIAELAELNRSTLRELIEQLDDGAFDMDLTGFNAAELEELMTAAPPANDPNVEWEGMPEFSQEDKTAWKNLIVNFKSKDDLEEFSRLINQTLTDRTRSIWYPQAEIERYADKVY